MNSINGHKIGVTGNKNLKASNVYMQVYIQNDTNTNRLFFQIFHFKKNNCFKNLKHSIQVKVKVQEIQDSSRPA